MGLIELNANAQSLVPGRLLYTRNAKKNGNAIVIGHGRELGLYKVKTDFGNVTPNINADEISSIWFLGEVTDLERWQEDRVKIMHRGFGEGTKGVSEIVHNMNPTGRGYRIPMPCSGIYFYPEDPRPEECFIEDVAHKLAQQCRYGGGTTRFYSVAEHCCLLHDWIRPAMKRPALMHDRAEFALQDILRPMKQKCQPWYGNMERNIEAVTAPVFDVPYPNPDEVMEADYRICIDEKQQGYGAIKFEAENEIERNALMNRPGHSKGALGVTLQFWSPERAKDEFLQRWHSLELAP